MLEEPARLLFRIIFRVFRIYFLLFERVVSVLFPSYRRNKTVEKILDGDIGALLPTVDERIIKIDLARSYLTDAIIAVDSLKSEAEANKVSVSQALARVDEVEAQKQEIITQLENLKLLSRAETKSFREIVGLPTRSDIWRERLMGFATGKLASIVASGIVFVIQSST